MIDKLIIDDAHIELSEKDTFPYTYQFSTAKTHTVKYALSDTDEISAGAFANCAYMTRIKFPKEIKMIKRRAFENCVRLDNVVIPNTIKYIGANVWNGCTGMTEMHFEHKATEDDPVPANFAEVPKQCKVYVPNDHKYAMVEKENGKNINMNPDSVDYYTKTDYNMYEYVAPQMLKDDGDYYYDLWTSIAPNSQTIEEKNRIPITSVDFEQDAFVVTSKGEMTLKYEVKPENATNRQLHFYNTDNMGQYAYILDSSKEGELVVDIRSGNIVTLSIYAENGVSSKCTLNIQVI